MLDFVEKYWKEPKDVIFTKAKGFKFNDLEPNFPGSVGHFENQTGIKGITDIEYRKGNTEVHFNINKSLTTAIDINGYGINSLVQVNAPLCPLLSVRNCSIKNFKVAGTLDLVTSLVIDSNTAKPIINVDCSNLPNLKNISSWDGYYTADEMTFSEVPKGLKNLTISIAKAGDITFNNIRDFAETLDYGAGDFSFNRLININSAAASEMKNVLISRGRTIKIL